MITQDTSQILSQILKIVTLLEEKYSGERDTNPLLSDDMPLRSAEQDKLYEAMAKAQLIMPIAKKSTIGGYKSKYMTYEDLVLAAKEALATHGLSVPQSIIDRDNGQRYLYTKLAHSSGQFEASRMLINPTERGIQKVGSELTYVKRYTFGAIAGVIGFETDDDGEEAMAEVREDFHPHKKEDNKKDPVKKNALGTQTISRDQYEILNNALKNHPDKDIAEALRISLEIETLANIPRDKYKAVLDHINRTRNALDGLDS